MFYKVERPTLEDGFPGLKKGPLATRDISSVDISAVPREFE